MSSGPQFNPGAPGGPGGFVGGQGGSRDGSSLPSHGHGPGGGPPATVTNLIAGSYGAPASFVSLLPLFGGSGGGGASAGGGFSGTSGGGGGGAIIIASSSSITVNGTIQARGGDGGGSGSGGGGSGGAIRLVAQQITGTGTLNAGGGSGGGSNPGRIRLEAFTLGFGGTITPTSALSTSTAPGPVTASSTPALTNLPMLTISSVGDGAAPTTPAGSYTTADVSLPAGTTNPVSVTLTAANTPVGTVFTVRLLPQFGVATSVSSFASTGTFATSTATANVNFPTGQVSVLNAFGSFTLPQIASLFPLIDGEEVDRILLAAAYGEPSSITLVTTSGRGIPVDRLSNEDLVRVALAFETLRATTL